MFEFFYRRTHLLFAIIGGMFLFGVIGLIKMPINLFPDSNRPEVVVFASMPGANPQTIATALAKPIEEEMATLSNVYEIKSTSVPNFAIIHIVFDYQKGLEEGAVDVTNGLNRIKAQLPPGVTTAIYLVGDFTMPADVFALSPKPGSGLTLADVRKITESFIKPRLLADKGIGNVEVFGGYQNSIVVKLDPLLLQKHQIPLKKVLSALQSVRDMPIGFLKSEGRFLNLTFYGEQGSVEKLKNLPITPSVKLGDLGKVEWSYRTYNSLYLGNGKPAIAVAVQRAPGGSLTETSDHARKIIAQLKREYPNIEFEISDTQIRLVKTSNLNMLEALRDAIIFTLLVLLFFLGNFRALVAAGVSIPMVFFGTIGFLYLTGHGLNIVIYTAIILALGMLTDDAVVVLENIERHLEEGDPNPIYNGTKEVLQPIFAGSVATIAIVAPLMFVGGFPEKIFRPLVETLIVALLISWFLSVTFIPKLAEFLYRNGAKKGKIEQFFEKLYQKTFGKLIPVYLGILKFSNKPPRILRRMLLFGGAMFVLMASLKNVMPVIGRDVMPPMDTGIIKAQIEFSSNLNADEARKRIEPFLKWLHSQNWVLNSSTAIGTEQGVLSMGGGGGGNTISMTILAVDRFHRKATIWELEDVIRDRLAQLPGVKNLAVFDFGATALSTISAPLDIQFRSDRFENLPQLANETAKLLTNLKGVTTIKTSWDKDYQEGVIKFDLPKMEVYGITPLDVIGQLLLKDQIVSIETSLSSLQPNPIIVRFGGEFGKNLEALRLLPIATPKGEVPLATFATINRHFTYTKITRQNLQYSIDVEGFRRTMPMSIITDESDKILQSHGITNYHQVGDIKEMDDSFARLIKAVAVGVLILILTLMVIYRSLKLALVMIFILPLSMIGGSWGMLVAHKPSCMPSMVGLLLLFGIIIKNAILLIDFYREFREKGESPFESALESVRIRFRPVMMTAFGTIAGMLPIAMEEAVGLERLSPLADVAVGGLLIGTILTLVYIPLLAYVTDREDYSSKSKN
ncbi:MAG: AcrB/AcrD/AcrF family protein [Epsilonproteobacteria bacterium]|nr:AcrB/AcrD/AcrF family protein [Campylobacterota bacterium]NPA88906.1 efflux RND transporter permease subunit [Campylobacterota bacterium]